MSPPHELRLVQLGGIPAEPFNFCFARQGGAEAVANKGAGLSIRNASHEAACSADRSVGFGE